MKTNLFRRLHDVLGNYMHDIATAEDVVLVAQHIDLYLAENPHPHKLNTGKERHDELIKVLKSNNQSIQDVVSELNKKRNISVQDVLKTAQYINDLKKMNATIRMALEYLK